MVALLAAVLAKAAGSLDISQIAYVIERRIPGTVAPQELGLDDPSEPPHVREAALSDRAGNPEDAYLAQEGEFDDGMDALRLYGELSDWERRILPVGDDLEQIAEAIGCGRSTANTRRLRLRAHLLEVNGGQPVSAAVLNELGELCTP